MHLPLPLQHNAHSFSVAIEGEDLEDLVSLCFSFASEGVGQVLADRDGDLLLVSAGHVDESTALTSLQESKFVLGCAREVFFPIELED